VISGRNILVGLSRTFHHGAGGTGGQISREVRVTSASIQFPRANNEYEINGSSGVVITMK
jgi:hypothetical protein